jgi:hypothetical protein
VSDVPACIRSLRAVWRPDALASAAVAVGQADGHRPVLAIVSRLIRPRLATLLPLPFPLDP